MSEAVFIFGAGASKEEMAPTTDELLPEAFKVITNDKKINQLKYFIKDFYFTNLEDPNTIPSFEDILGLVDMALQRQECFSAKWNRKRLLIVKENLLYAVCNIINEKLRERGTIHRRFLQNLVEQQDFAHDKYAFLSLNYDILLDNAIADLRARRGFDLDYGLEFINFDQDWFRPREGRDILLLKLHGSLNWVWCPTCNSVKVGRGKKIVLGIWTESTKCKNDHTLQEPLIILPAWHKSYDNPHISTIWFKAEKVLRRTKKVFFVGCSLRESDVNVRYLVKKSLFRKGGAPVVVIDKKRTENEEDRRQKESIKNAYKKIFGNVDYQPVGFRQFAENTQQYL
jgi:hypothetical protein